MISTGIDDISLYTSSFYLDMHILAEKRNADYSKYTDGIGIERISIPSPDEDIITLAANAALPVVQRCDKTKIGTLLFATESGVDQSKSAAVFVHRLLDLPSTCRTVELKQACYSSTAAVQAACALVARNPKKTVLVITADVAHYPLESPGEATQGCGAVAMLITENPRILEIHPESGCCSTDCWDFWRPNYSNYPLYDGKFSMINYVKTCKAAWKELAEVRGISFDQIDRFCYHLPFSTMGLKAHLKLAREAGSQKSAAELENQLEPIIQYCKVIGNCYSASLYFALCSLLDNAPERLENKLVALFAYGSGCSGEFYTGTFQPGYKKCIRTETNKKLIKSRKEIDFGTYLQFHKAADPIGEDSGDCTTPEMTEGAFRYCGIKDHCRIYEPCSKNAQ